MINVVPSIDLDVLFPRSEKECKQAFATGNDKLFEMARKLKCNISDCQDLNDIEDKIIEKLLNKDHENEKENYYVLLSQIKCNLYTMSENKNIDKREGVEII
ncbi:hypothetical protein HBP99_13830 [Listeria booriae]|uniref:hypothetical protein n=1 Tax=Listeria booriae TaxID=1552123 RepID=UPI001625D27C|nr:hypothetical protein [Listeria booriae]MBC2369722.1 hypothetical protein [Listeria booriae]